MTSVTRCSIPGTRESQSTRARSIVRRGLCAEIIARLLQENFEHDFDEGKSEIEASNRGSRLSIRAGIDFQFVVGCSRLGRLAGLAFAILSMRE